VSSGPFGYLRLLIVKAFRHSYHDAHSLYVALVIVATWLVSLTPGVEDIQELVHKLEGKILTWLIGSLIVARFLLDDRELRAHQKAKKHAALA
jgi:hypothetical protein